MLRDKIYMIRAHCNLGKIDRLRRNHEYLCDMFIDLNKNIYIEYLFREAPPTLKINEDYENRHYNNVKLELINVSELNYNSLFAFKLLDDILLKDKIFLKYPVRVLHQVYANIFVLMTRKKQLKQMILIVIYIKIINREIKYI